jgi:hypothetical protein
VAGGFCVHRKKPGNRRAGVVSCNSGPDIERWGC